MDLKKFLPSVGDKGKIEHYWALVIEPGWVSAGIWRIQNQKAQVIYTSQPSAWELDDELLNASDTAISSAIQDYPGEYEEPQKTVFGVSYKWVSGGEISAEYLEKIKKICKSLSLTPLGFVVLPEAISNLIKAEEGTPLNGVVLGIYKELIEVSLFELGKLSGTTQVSRSISLVEDIIEGLSRLKTGGTFPSRFLIYDGREGELEEIRQVILKSNWEDLEELKFLHTPKIEIIDFKRKIYAVSLAGASELASVTLLEDVSTKKEEPFTTESEEDVAVEPIEETGVSPEELGFIPENEVQEELQEEEKIEENLAGETPLNYEPDTVETQEVESNVRPVLPDELEKKPKAPPMQISLGGLGGLKDGLVKTLSFTRNLGNKRMPFFWGFIFLIVLGLGLFAAWWFIPKATVTIYVSPKKLEQNLDLTIDTKRQNSDVGNKILKGEVLETSTTGERTMDTSGTKTVGDKAQGEVSIYRVGPEISLNSGTVIYGPDKIKFTTDNSITIASGSASTPGITKVKVTAVDIGAQSNLASGATFTVGNYSSSDMEAKNESAFSGGTSKEINAVSKEDQDTLQKQLENELKERGLDSIKEKLDLTKYFVDPSQTFKSTDVVFNHKVGDEAKTLKLSLTLSVSAFSVQKTELENLAKEMLKEKVPQGFVLRGEQINYSFEKGDSEKDPTKFKVKISANLLPELKTDEIAKKLVGKNTKMAVEYLQKEAPGFETVEIRLKPSILTGKLGILPHVSKNIDVQISAKK